MHKKSKKSKRKPAGLVKYRRVITKATSAVSKRIKKTETQLKKLRALKKARVKKATAAYRRKHKK